MEQPKCCNEGTTPISSRQEVLAHCKQSQCPFFKKAEVSNDITFSNLLDCEQCQDCILEMEIKRLDSSREM